MNLNIGWVLTEGRPGKRKSELLSAHYVLSTKHPERRVADGQRTSSPGTPLIIRLSISPHMRGRLVARSLVDMVLYELAMTQLLNHYGTLLP